jgi:quercetin dioxygenase-like cupin family protein
MNVLSKMKISNYEDVEAKRAEEGAKNVTIRWLITKEMGAENFAMRYIEVDPGGSTPLHSHPWEHEIFILEGEGVMANGQEEKRFTKGNFIFIPPNETHQSRNTGQTTIRLLCMIPYAKMR